MIAYAKVYVELPPRARRIPPAVTDDLPPAGTTSACAENTLAQKAGVVLGGNYLRVRGEYRLLGLWRVRLMELPPRARRIQNHQGTIPP
nr:MAG TPA: hypothetical protein [Caudoviricetes sp.]